MKESDLVQKAASGDRDAFALLLECYQKQVYHQALRMVSNPEDAADMTQEAFFKAWQGLPSFQGDSSFATWLYRLTNNVCIDFLRREKKRRGDASLDDEARESAFSLSDPSPTPQRALEEKERRRAIEDGLAQLSDGHRQVLVLREINGLSYEEIARILDLPPGTVKSRIARARLALANFLRESGNFSDFHSST